MNSFDKTQELSLTLFINYNEDRQSSISSRLNKHGDYIIVETISKSTIIMLRFLYKNQNFIL